MCSFVYCVLSAAYGVRNDDDRVNFPAQVPPTTYSRVSDFRSHKTRFGGGVTYTRTHEYTVGLYMLVFV